MPTQASIRRLLQRNQLLRKSFSSSRYRAYGTAWRSTKDQLRATLSDPIEYAKCRRQFWDAVRSQVYIEYIGQAARKAVRALTLGMSVALAFRLVELILNILETSDLRVRSDSFIALATGLTFSFVVIAISARQSERGQTNLLLVGAYASLLLVGGFASAQPTESEDPSLLLPATAVLLTTFMLLFPLLVWKSSNRLPRIFQKSMTKPDLINQAAITDAATLLACLGLPPQIPQSIGNRRHLLVATRNLAESITWSSRALRGESSEIKNFLGEHISVAAASILEMRYWIIWQEEQAAVRIQQRTSSALTALLSGRECHFPQPDNNPPSRSRIQRVIETLGILTIAATPIGVVQVIRALNPSSLQSLDGPVVVFALLWLFAGVIVIAGRIIPSGQASINELIQMFRQSR